LMVGDALSGIGCEGMSCMECGQCTIVHDGNANAEYRTNM
jgi:ferredoxin-like protein FixX